jgi:hypothetical protein
LNWNLCPYKCLGVGFLGILLESPLGNPSTSPDRTAECYNPGVPLNEGPESTSVHDRGLVPRVDRSQKAFEMLIIQP